MTLDERFWEKVTVADDASCWLWIGAKNARGYGQMTVDGKTMKAHRISWQMANTRIPPGLCVLHKCDNPSCVNPAHLFLGTYADNIRDMVKKGRNFVARGEKNGESKLTESKVRAIKNDERNMSEIADDYSVSYAAIWDVKNGRTWAWVS